MSQADWERRKKVVWHPEAPVCRIYTSGHVMIRLCDNDMAYIVAAVDAIGKEKPEAVEDWEDDSPDVLLELGGFDDGRHRLQLGSVCHFPIDDESLKHLADALRAKLVERFGSFELARFI